MRPIELLADAIAGLPVDPTDHLQVLEPLEALGLTSQAALAAMEIAAVVEYVRTLGRNGADGVGGIDMVRVGAAPSHPGYRQSLDGAFWEFVAPRHALDYRTHGTGAQAINDAIAFMATKANGGEVVIPEDVTISGQIVAADKVKLRIPAGVTLTLDTPIVGAFIYGEDVPDFTVLGGGKIDVGGNASWAINILGRSRIPIWGIEIVNWKGGARIEANATSPIGECIIRDFKAHENFVHPTSPATLSLASHALSITCRPSQGHALTEKVMLDNVHLEARAAGATDGLNQYTKDLCSVQGAKVLWINQFISRRSGEVGLSATFGCQHVVIQNSRVEEADGHGIVLSGAHYRVDVNAITGGTGAFNDTSTAAETVDDGGSVSGRCEYFIDHGDGTATLWLDTPSRGKFAPGDTITGAVTGTQATVTASWPALTCEVHKSVETVGNGIDVHDVADYAGVHAQHVQSGFLSGTHRENKPFGVKVNSSDFALGDLRCPTDPLGPQTQAVDSVGASVFFGRDLSPIEIDDLVGANTDNQANNGARINGARQYEHVANGAELMKLNRAGSATTSLGDVIQIYRLGQKVSALGTDGIQFPGTTASAAFGDTTLPDPATVPRKVNYSGNSRGGSPALVRSDGAKHTCLVTGVPGRDTVWDKTALDAVTGLIIGGTVYCSDGDQGHPSLATWDGTAWQHRPVQPPAGTATIADTDTRVTVTFGTARNATTYTANPIPHDDEHVWIENKATTGFDIVRAGTSGELVVDWDLTSHANP